jgi:hypothetical protein
MKLEFYRQILGGKRKKKAAQISNFITICPVGAELFHVDGQTDVLKLAVAFLNFVNAPKNEFG